MYFKTKRYIKNITAFFMIHAKRPFASRSDYLDRYTDIILTPTVAKFKVKQDIRLPSVDKYVRVKFK